MARLPSAVLAAAILAPLLAPSPALAWVEARVRRVDALVRLPGDPGTGSADVRLEIEVQVARGWLERLDVPGLPPGTVSATVDPVALFAEDGAREDADPSLTVDEAGHAVVRFPRGRRRAPGRGLHRLRLDLAAPFNPARLGPGDRATWGLALPPWNAGLDLPRVVYRAPYPISAAGRPGDVEPGVSIRVSRPDDDPTAYQVRFDRVHLPRESAWSPRVVVPDAFAPAPPAPTGLAAPARARPEPRVRVAGPTAADVGLGGAWGLLLLALAFGPGRHHFGPGPGRLGRGLLVVLGLGGAIALRVLPLGLPGVVALAPLAVAGLAALGRRDPALRGSSAPLDARRPLGLGLLLTGLTGVVAAALAADPTLPNRAAEGEILAGALALASVPWFASTEVPHRTEADVVPLAARRPRDGVDQRSRAASAR